MKKILSGGLGMSIVLSLVLPAFAQTSKRPMNLGDLEKLVHVGDPQVSPDGGWVAYSASQVDVTEDKSVSGIWMVRWDGKEDIQLTHGKESASSPRWSPDGRWLAFVSSREGEAKGGQVWLLNRRGGEATQLTKVKEDLLDYRWSPDSRQLLLTLQEKEEPEPEKGAKPVPPKPIVLDRYHFKQDKEGYLTAKQPHLYLFSLDTKKTTRLTDTPVTNDMASAEESGEWSPDGKQIAFVSNRSTPDPDRVDNPDIFVVNAAAGSTPRKVTDFSGRDEGPLAWSADSTRIVYRRGVSPHYSIYDMPQLASVAATGGEPQLLAPKLDQWVGAPTMLADGKSLLTTVADDRQQYVVQLSLDGKTSPKRVMQPADSGTVSEMDQAAGHVAVLWTSDLAAPEIYAFEEGRLRKLTSHNDVLLGSLVLSSAQDLSARTSDGNDVHSLLTMPTGYVAGTKVPMLLRIHGGPTAQDAHGFSPERQLLAGRGFAVLNVNYRGSTGRGHAYSETIHADWGHKEVIDLLAAVDGAVATGSIDADKLGIGGWSYGGILTDYTIATTTRFKAASSGAGMGNLLVLYGIDEYILQYENEIGTPWKHPDLYVQLSYPFFHADRIKTPTLFMGGDKDFNVPLAGSEQMYQALRSVGTPAQLIVYPGEFHGFTRPSFIKDRYQRWFDWYDKYVKGVQPSVVPATAAAAH